MSGKTECVDYLYVNFDWSILKRVGIKHYDDLKHDIVLILYQQTTEVLNQIIDRKQFQFFITRIVCNQRNYKGSNYHKNYSTEKFIYEMPDIPEHVEDLEIKEKENINSELQSSCYNDVIKKYSRFDNLTDIELLKSLCHFFWIRKIKQKMKLKDLSKLTGYSEVTLRKYLRIVKAEILLEYNKNRII